MDLRRRATIAAAKPQDFGDHAPIEQPLKNFDIMKSVFRTSDPERLGYVKEQFAKELFWSDRAITDVEAMVAKMRANTPNLDALIPDHSPALMKFLLEECEFNVEHADGSFLDHLQFCYEFNCIYMPQHSALPSFLHSIMGVGTNLFPMKLEQKPRLAELVSAEDLIQIEALPTVVRLLPSAGLLAELVAMSDEKLRCIDGLECYRLLGPNMDHDGLIGKSDNAPIYLNAEQFWLQLNYHLIHFMDFIPLQQWKERLNSSWLHAFIDLHHVLTRAGKLMAKIDFDSEKWVKEIAATETTEQRELRKAGAQFLVDFSNKIGHSLEYKMKFKGAHSRL